MMKKTIKKLLAALLAVAMLCAMAIPAFAGTEGDITTWHSFSAFQIFKGDVEGNDIKDFKISNVTWGSNIADNPAAFLDQLKADSTLGTQFQFIDATDANTAQKVLEVISKWDDSDANSIAFARFVCHYLYPDANAKPKPAVEGGCGSNSFHFDEAGYYLVVDTTPFNPGDFDHAYNSFLLMVTHDNWNVPITPKAEKPSVKKEVFDNFDNQDGTSTGVFGSSADHAINEKFQFKLTATLPASTDHAYDYYDTYAVCFKDTLSEGITYDGPDSVVIKSNNNTYNITDTLKYTINTDNLETQNYFEVNIPDVKTCAEGLDLKGDLLSQVHIHKIAFPPIDSPVVITEGEWLKSLNRYPFEVQSLPSASFNLIQQVGRLIRSHGCWGEVVIYDKRLLTKNYGKRLLDALPVFPIEQPEVPEGIVKKKEKTKSPRRRRR